MATLDVRNTTDDEITHIQFGSFHNGCSGIMTLSGNTDEIAIYDKEEKMVAILELMTLIT